RRGRAYCRAMPPSMNPAIGPTPGTTASGAAGMAAATGPAGQASSSSTGPTGQGRSPAGPAGAVEPGRGTERGRGARRQLGVDTVYSIFTGMPIAVIAFSLCFTAFALGVSLIITIIGLPVLSIAFYITRGFADVHRWNLQNVLNRPVPRPRYLRAAPDTGW